MELQGSVLVPGPAAVGSTVNPEQLAAQRANQGWFLPILNKIARNGLIYYPLNECELVPAGDGTVSQTPISLMSRTPRALITEAKTAVQQNAVKRFFGGIVPAAGTDLAVVAAQQAFGWRVRISCDVLNWNFGQIKVKLTYNSQDRVLYVAPLAGRPYVDFVALAFSDNAGKGVLQGPATMTLTIFNPAVVADSPGTIPTKTAVTIETINVRDLGTDFE